MRWNANSRCYAAERARAVLAAQDCGVLLRTFDPAEVPAVLLRDADAERARDLAQEAEDAGGAWGGLLGSFTEAATEPTRTLVLNDANENTRRLLHQPEHASFEPGLTTLYLSALMLAGEGLRGQKPTCSATAWPSCSKPPCASPKLATNKGENCVVNPRSRPENCRDPRPALR